MRLRSGDKHHLRKSADRKAQISLVSGTNAVLICAFPICRFPKVVFIPRAQLHAPSLFLFPIVIGINLIHFFDEKKDGAAGNSIVCFGASIPCHAIWQKRRRMRTVSKSATYLRATKVWIQRHSRGESEKEVHFFWQGKVQNSSPILRCTFWQGKVHNALPIITCY